MRRPTDTKCMSFDDVHKKGTFFLQKVKNRAIRQYQRISESIIKCILGNGWTVLTEGLGCAITHFISCIPVVVTILRGKNSATQCFRFHPLEGLRFHPTSVFGKRVVRMFPPLDGLADASATPPAEGARQGLVLLHYI
jgi:hypothetical protein